MVITAATKPQEHTGNTSKQTVHSEVCVSSLWVTRELFLERDAVVAAIVKLVVEKKFY